MEFNFWQEFDLVGFLIVIAVIELPADCVTSDSPRWALVLESLASYFENQSQFCGCSRVSLRGPGGFHERLVGW